MNNLGKYVMKYQQAAYDGLKMLLQPEWQYLHQGVLGVGTFMVTVEEAL